MTDNTIFDDTFCTMVEKMSRLVIPVINEVFGTSYPENAKIIQLRNEHHDPRSGKVITDSCLQIDEMLYHIECQSTDDTTMAVRMIEYDFRIGVEHAQKDGRRYRIRLPRSCVLYLRDTAATQDYLEADVEFSDGRACTYRIPTVKVNAYTINAIFAKRLLLFLPFYAMRYEKQAARLEEDPEQLQRFLAEFSYIVTRMLHEPDSQEHLAMYMDLKNLIIKIADYIFAGKEKIRKGIGDIMGGKVFELESERLLRIGREDGRKEGRARGRAEGHAEGRAEGRAEGEEYMGKLVNALINDGRFDDISLAANNPEFRKRLFVYYGIDQSEDEHVS